MYCIDPNCIFKLRFNIVKIDLFKTENPSSLVGWKNISYNRTIKCNPLKMSQVEPQINPS